MLIINMIITMIMKLIIIKMQMIRMKVNDNACAGSGSDGAGQVRPGAGWPGRRGPRAQVAQVAGHMEMGTSRRQSTFCATCWPKISFVAL